MPVKRKLAIVPVAFPGLAAAQAAFGQCYARLGRVMTSVLFILFLFLALFSVSTNANRSEKNPMNVKRITPVLFVKEIEPVLPFWIDALGFAKTIEVPHGDKLGFVALQKGNTEVMYQSYASIGEDIPLIVEATKKGPTFLYIEVDNLDAVLAALKNTKIVQPERTTFYGMREVGYQDSGGHFITFAQPVATGQK
jgi:uncharacterized glyoxalase superfamily protein PhnB